VDSRAPPDNLWLITVCVWGSEWWAVVCVRIQTNRKWTNEQL